MDSNLNITIQSSENLDNQELLKAINCYTRALDVNPDEAVLYSNRAICEIQLKQFDLARQDAECAIRLDRKNVKFYRVLAEALMGLEAYEKALEACQQGLKLDPREATLLTRQRECKPKISGTNDQWQMIARQKRKNSIDSQSDEVEKECSPAKKSKTESDTSMPDDVENWSNRNEDDSSEYSELSEDPIFPEEYNEDPAVEALLLFGLFPPTSASTKNSIMYDESKLIPAMMERRDQGSPSAKLFFEAVRLIAEAQQLLSEEKFTESFVKIRQMMCTWRPKTFKPTPFIEAARRVLKTDAKNHAAMYIIVAFDPEKDQKQRLVLANRLVKMDPSIPEYHVIQSTCYLNPRLAVSSLDKSIEISPNPEMMCLRAHILQNAIRAKDEIVTEAFQQFLSSVPSDYMRVPDAYYQMGYIQSTKDPAKAAALYRLGQIADHSSIRLPCLPNLEDDLVRLHLKNYLEWREHWPIPDDVLDDVDMCFTCTKTESLSPCTTCHKARYCSKQCQENNWIIHKWFCLP